MRDKQYFIENFDRAIREKWIRVYYQPIVRSTNGKICGQEALSRWIDPDGDIYTPDEFIPVLEEADLICRLDLYVIDQILERVHIQEEIGMPDVRQSVNISEKDFFACDLPEEIRRRVDYAGYPRNMLALEIEENAVAGDYSFIKDQIERLHGMGFPVWLDTYGNACFSVDLFRRTSLDLIKFDLDYIRQFESEEAGRIVLSELMKMTIGLGIDTVCEGVETEEEERFLREIGCEKLQGYFYGEAVPFEMIQELFRESTGIPVENAEESSYYDEIGRINLYDFAVLSKKEENALAHYFNTIPMAIMEVREDKVDFVRTNRSYREFVQKVVERDIGGKDRHFSASEAFYRSPFLKCVKRCCKNKDRTFVSEKLPDGSTVRSFVRWLADNPLTDAAAVAVAVISVTDAEQDTTYENIARALAADYFDLFYVNLDTDDFIEYRSDAGEEELAIERSGTDFFAMLRRDAKAKIVEDDLEHFLFSFTKENVLRSLETQGTYTTAFRMLINDRPIKVNLKARRMQPGDSHIIIGMNIIDEQAKLQEGYERQVIAGALRGTEAAGLESLSLNAASFAVKSCVKLMGSGDFKDNVRAVLTDIMELARAESARVLLADKERKTVSIFTKIDRPGCFPDREEQSTLLSYEVVATWEAQIGENNAVVIGNEADRENIRKNCPAWWETMKRDGIKDLVLVPLRRNELILGYLYVLNHNTRKTEKIRETIELVSYFLSSEISNYLFRQELERLSNYDQLTGLKNRHAMLCRNHRLEEMESCCFGVLTMDLNGLKKVNDTLGHFAGDELIQNAAEVLKNEFGEEELYRIGGDEFIVIFPGISEEEFTERTRKFREETLPSSGISMSCGTVWAGNNDAVESVFYQADQKMYANKKAFYEQQAKKG